MSITEIDKPKQYDELTFIDDFMFCRVLSIHPEICKQLAEIFTGRKIARIGAVNDQKPVKITKEAKGVRFDIYFCDDENTAYDFEMQASQKYNEPKRTRYYQAINDMQLLTSGKTYKELPDCYIIFICMFDPFGNDLCRYTFENRCVENNNIALKDGCHKIFLNAFGSEGDMPENIKKFLDYLKTNKPTDNLTAEIEAAVEEQINNEEGRFDYMKLLDIYSEIEEEATERGHKRGFEQGLEQGVEQGLEKGKIYGSVETMRDLDFTDDQIIKRIIKNYNLTEEQANTYLAEAASTYYKQSKN